jgi:iron complex transport system substrate-binding protein
MKIGKSLSFLILIAVICGGLVSGFFISQFYHSKNTDSQYERIISIAAACTEIIYALGAGDKLVGVDQFSINYALVGELVFQGAPGQLSAYPKEVPNKTNVGTTSALNLELVASLNSSLAFSWGWAKTANTALEGLGLEVIEINPQSIGDVLNLTKTIGVLLGKSTEAEGVCSEIENRIINLTNKLENITEAEKPLVYYELASLGKTTGPGTITNEMIVAAGGENLAANESVSYPTLSSEYIVARNPDIIIVVSYGASIADIKNRAGWGNISAVQNDKIYQLESGWATASPRLVLGLEQLSKWFFPALW